jgi:hypothetical protein
MCAGKQDLLSSECQVIEPGAVTDFRGGGSGVLSCRAFFPFFLWLVVSLFVVLERALLIAGYGTLWVTFGGPLIFLFQGS